MNLFEYATRNKLTFPSARGQLTIEQLWDVPLLSSDNFNLDAIAKAAHEAFKNAELSFVEATKTDKQTRYEMTFEVVKYVIETKLAEKAAAEKRAANKLEKEQLLKALAEKQEGKLSALTEKELRKRIAELS